jgi:hypothetical protein
MTDTKFPVRKGLHRQNATSRKNLSKKQERTRFQFQPYGIAPEGVENALTEAQQPQQALRQS